MIIAQRWDPFKNKYDPHMIFDRASAFETDMDKKIQCAECGEVISYGEGFTSLHIHTKGGYGYAVCGKCYEKEIERERLAAKFMGETE